MKLAKKVTLAMAAVAVLATAASARDQIRIVGSSTVFPFSSYVAEELGAAGKFPTPVVESTGTGGGMKLFCKGNGLDTPDITNASRRMKDSEFKMCEENGVKSITEALIGFDGIAIAQNKSNGAINFTREQLAMAVAAEVPGKDGKLIANPYKKWNEIDATLPDREIVVYGPPTSSGTRDAFEELVLMEATKKNKVYEAAAPADKKFEGYKKIREDGAYVPSGENDNLIVQKLEKNKDAFGIFGYSFLEENADKVAGATIEGVAPSPESVSSGKYKVSRSLFYYIKNDHAKEVPALNEFTKLFMSEKMIGEKGALKAIGLIPLPQDAREKARAVVEKSELVTVEKLKSH